MINLWASWCGPCRDELPVIEAFAKANAGSVDVLGVNTQDTESAARSIVEDFGMTYPSRVDPNARLLTLLGKRVLPVTAFVTGDGTVAYVYSGPALSPSVLADLAREHLGVG